MKHLAEVWGLIPVCPKVAYVLEKWYSYNNIEDAPDKVATIKGWEK